MLAPVTYTSFDAGASAPSPSPTVPQELTRRLAESFGSMSPWGWPQLWQSWQDSTIPGPGGFPYRGASGTTNDRRAGRDLPFFWSEVDLRGYRVTSRFLCETNPFAIGFLGRLTDYHIRRGYGWQACKRGARKTPYAGTSGGAAPADPLVAKAQRVLDEFRDRERWPQMSREAFARWRRDGEVFLRVGRGGWGEPPWVRFVEPEQVGSPDGATDGPDAFGIAVRQWEDGQLDPRTVEAYHVWDLESGMTRGEWVDGDRIVHAKANVDSTVRRGRPDFFPVGDHLDGVRRLLNNILFTAVDQAAIAWRERFPTASKEQVRTLIPEQVTTPGQSQSTSTPPGAWSVFPWMVPQWGNANKFRPGTVIRVEGNREFEDGPVSQGVPNYLQAVQAILRSVGARWGMPEYFSGDASNNNFASSLVAGSPFVVAVEGSQLEWGSTVERPVALKVLDRAVDAGILSREEREALDVEVTEPAVVTPEPEKDTARRNTLHAAGVLSATTWQQQEGLDPQHEAANFDTEKQRAGSTADGSAVDGGSTETPVSVDDGDDPLAALFGEGEVVSEAGRAGLVAKKITVKGMGGKEFQRTVWVRPEQPAAKKPTAAKVPAAKSAPKSAPEKPAKADPATVAEEVHAALAEPEKLTPELVKAVTDRLKTLTVEQIKAIQAARGKSAAGGKDKAARIQKLIDDAKARAAAKKEPEKPEPEKKPAVDVAGVYDRSGSSARNSEVNAAIRAVAGMTDDEAAAVIRSFDGFEVDPETNPRRQLAMMIFNRRASQSRGVSAGRGKDADAAARAAFAKVEDEPLLDPEAALSGVPKRPSQAKSPPLWPAATNGPAETPHARARAALDALGVPHGHLTDDDLAARLKAALSPEKTAAKAAKGKAEPAALPKVADHVKGVNAAVERAKSHEIAKDIAKANAHADEVIASLSGLSDDEVKAVAKGVTGKAGRTRKQALDSIRADLTAVARALDSQKV